MVEFPLNMGLGGNLHQKPWISSFKQMGGPENGAVWPIHRQQEAAYTIITLWLFNIAMENGPFIDGLPIKNGDFPWLC